MPVSGISGVSPHPSRAAVASTPGSSASCVTTNIHGRSCRRPMRTPASAGLQRGDGMPRPVSTATLKNAMARPLKM